MKKKRLTPIELLKEGIQKGNWQNVCNAYKKLTGDELKAPKEITATLEETGESQKLREAFENLCSFVDSIRNDLTLDKAAEILGGVEDEEDEEEPDEVVSKPKDKEGDLENPPKLDQDTEIAISTYDDKFVAGPKTGLVAGKVNAKLNKIHFVTDLKEDKEERVRNQRIAKKTEKVPRKQYTPRMIKCLNCQQSFDLNKYPAAPRMASAGEAKEIKCPKCKTNFAA